MARLIKSLYDYAIGDNKPSEKAQEIGKVFEGVNGGGLDFLDLVVQKFNDYDKSNDRDKNKKFSTDVDFIIEVATESLKSPEYIKLFAERIDAYFYIYRRIKQYIGFLKEKKNRIEKFQREFDRQLISLFQSSNGLKPNLYTEDEKLLKLIDLQRHINTITEIPSTDMLQLFFVFCKLAFQASLIIKKESPLTWSNLLQGIREWQNISIKDFNELYEKYCQAFEQFPLDMPAIIYLASIDELCKDLEQRPFIAYCKLIEISELDLKNFFEQFQTRFHEIMRQKLYLVADISFLLDLLSRGDPMLFRKYLSVFSKCTTPQAVWDVFLNISKSYEINQCIEKYLSMTLIMRTENLLPVEVINYYNKSIKYLNEQKVESSDAFRRMLDDILCKCLDKQLNDEKYSSSLKEHDLTQLLKFALHLPTTHSLQHPSCLLIIRHLLFKLDKHKTNKPSKIEDLFKKLIRLDNFIQNDLPSDIIKDEWLDDYVFNIPSDWLNMSLNDYTALTSNHKDNRWSEHIWSRIVYLSFMKLQMAEPNETLVSLNDWLNTIKHNVYDKNDYLTIILVNNIFENIIQKTVNSILFLPNIQTTIQYILHAREERCPSINIYQVNEFIQKQHSVIENILTLKESRTTYNWLLQNSIVDEFVSFYDLERIIKSVDPGKYKFPLINSKIDSIVSIPKPENINLTVAESKKDFFKNFIQQVDNWLKWFDEFLGLFQDIIKWLNKSGVENSDDLYNKIHAIKTNRSMSIIEIKENIQKIIDMLRSVDDLQRLCHLFDCLQSFKVIRDGALMLPEPWKNFQSNLIQLHPNNKFQVAVRAVHKHLIDIDDRRIVRWSIICDQHECNITVSFQINDSQESHVLFDQEDAPINKKILRGEFKSLKKGYLIINIDNENRHAPRTIRYEILPIPTQTCHLFHGIFTICFRQFFEEPNQLVKISDMNRTTKKTFSFIDTLLSGEIKLHEIQGLQTVFYDKNINVREEVRQLFVNRSISNNQTTDQLNDREIGQVCEWLQTYQYYSHMNSIINCIQKFNIIKNDGEHGESMNSLQQLNIDTNSSLKKMSETYNELRERFQKLTNHHLQLIKTMTICSNVVQQMSKSDLYSAQGLRRFQELKDNLTAQFQLQERNNMILNSWIITHTLCAPFVYQVNTIEEFIDSVSRLSNIDEHSLEHIKIVNDNSQTVALWLSTEHTSMLDNALIVMEHLYKTGRIKYYLRRLINEESYFEIEYSIDRSSIKRILSMSDTDDHKRQLTFCNVDLQSNMIDKKILLNEQLNLFEILTKIYSILKQLETSGHPNFQLKEEEFDIYIQLDPQDHNDNNQNEFQRFLNDLKNSTEENEDELKQLIVKRTQQLERRYQHFKSLYELWIEDLNNCRQQYRLLKLFSNHQIMIMTILLTKPTEQNRIQHSFLRTLFSGNKLDQTDHQQEQLNLNILCLTHYLRSLRISQCNLSQNNVIDLYHRHAIDYQQANLNLQPLCSFLKDLFKNERDLFNRNGSSDENQQFLITLSPLERKGTKLNIFNEFDIDMCCILMNIFQDQLPAEYQILWCSIATENDIRLFFSRVRIFRHLTFAVMDIDRVHHGLRESLFNEQNSLAIQTEQHGSVYYFSRELNLCRKGLRPFIIKPQHKNPSETFTHFSQLIRKSSLSLPNIKMITGKSGIGKTHSIKTNYKGENTCCIGINDTINLSSLISSFLSIESQTLDRPSTVYFNIHLYTPFEQLNRLLFSLFICGSLTDFNSGLTFSPSTSKQWQYIFEVPYSDYVDRTVQENSKYLLPVLSMISSNNINEITETNYELYIDEQEELVARFLKAFENRTIDRMYTEHIPGRECPVDFDKLTDHNECRRYILQCKDTYASELPKNKIFELTFTKFLYRRFRFFTGFQYRYNITYQKLGSTIMPQMINEARCLTQIDFSTETYPRIYLVYDKEFSLCVLHNDWNQVSQDLKTIFKNADPAKNEEHQNKNYAVVCLSWVVDIPYRMFEQVMKEMKFILTENFTYKLFHIHERKLTKLPLIIEGETGVGKTFLLKFYSSLLNVRVTHGELHDNVSPRIRERTSLWLCKHVFDGLLKNKPNLNYVLLRKIQSILSNNPIDDEDIEGQLDGQIDGNDPLENIKKSLYHGEYSSDILQSIWKSIISISTRIQNENNLTKRLLTDLHEFIVQQLTKLPLAKASHQLGTLLSTWKVPTSEKSIEILNEFLNYTEIKPLFYRLLLHPGVTEEQIEGFISPICRLAREVPDVELVVFFDEVNTSSCLGLFKEMFMDGTLHGTDLPKNIFFTAAINPYREESNDEQVHRSTYNVHRLPQSLDNLKVSYSILDRCTLEDYIKQKIATFTVSSITDPTIQQPLEEYHQTVLTKCILDAQEFCEKRLERNSVSQREIQRCFNLVDFFWKLKYDRNEFEPDAMRYIALALALTYYFRLPTKEDNTQRKDDKTPSREDLADLLSKTVPNFTETIQNELNKFVNTDNFIIPHGVAVNQAIREHIFSIVVSIITRTPLCIIGAPGQSKTLSFQIVLQNLQGPQLSSTEFCKNLPAIDAFFSLGSKYMQSDDIAYVFERAIQREQQYEQNRLNTRCVVFLDEASLPDENKMVLKVLHPYLDECKVAFVAVANRSFDPANANRMLCIYRSLPSENDQQILARGCLGLSDENENASLKKVISGLCQGYRRMLTSPTIPKIFHDRDFIYMLRELRFELPTTNLDEEDININRIQPISLLRALEDNFNGITRSELRELVNIFFEAVKEKSPNFVLPREKDFRNVPTVLRESLKLDSKRRRLYGRYKLIIDESDDESAINLLFQTGILDSNPAKTTVFRMSDFADDVNNELRNVEILSTIKLCMETGKTILMVNTSRIHDSLYDVFNQNFSIMATGDVRKIFSKVAIGPKTVDVIVHEDFQCIVHVKRSEFRDIPAPFLSRFQKYSLSVNDFYHIRLQRLPADQQTILVNVQQKLQSFIEHFGREYFYGFTDNTLYSCLLSLIKHKDNQTDEYSLINIQECYTQLNIKLKTFYEQNLPDLQLCFVRLILSKLIQLISPEAIIVKLPTFEDKVEQWLCRLYFQQQEHFNIENILLQLVQTSSMNTDNVEQVNQQNTFRRTTKLMIFTRTSSRIVGLNQKTKNELLSEQSRLKKQIEILNLISIENSTEFQEKLTQYENDQTKNLLLIIIDGRVSQQRLHIPFVRQLIDKTDNTYNRNHPNNQQKYFLILVHSSAQDLYHQSSFPSIFLGHWDFYFFDSCAPGSSFHLQKMLEILSSSTNENQTDTTDDHFLCDLNILFDDCLWEFSSRVQIILNNLSKDLFTNKHAYEFYQRQTNTIRRVECLKEIVRQAQQLQTHIVDVYHRSLSTKENASEQIYKLIYDISKDILCSKRFDGLIESIQVQTRNSFTNFVSNVFKFIVNDYGLDNLHKLSTDYQTYGSLLNLIDYQSFSANNNQDIFSSNSIQSIFQLTTHYSCIPQTPLYHLFHERIKDHANEIKLLLIRRQTEAKVDDDNELVQCTFEDFRFQLSNSLINDSIIEKISCDPIVRSYSNDLIRTYCSIIENNFNTNREQYEQTIEFVSRWLLLIDEKDHQSLDGFTKKSIWYLAHIYTSFEYEQNDLLSMYSACRAINHLNLKQQSYDNFFHRENTTRSNVREWFFRQIFDDLWTKFCQICSTNEDNQTWIYTYTFITKYYPSENVLQGLQLKDIQSQIDLMNLAYLLFLNENISRKSQQLISLILEQTNFNQTSTCFKLLPDITNILSQYLNDNQIDKLTIMIDLQQWILMILKSTLTKQSFDLNIRFLFRYLVDYSSQFTLATKQILFNEFTNVFLKLKLKKDNLDFWDRFEILPVLLECCSNIEQHENYKIPSHPTIVPSDNADEFETRPILLDLYFFYLQQQIKTENIHIKLLNQGMLLPMPKVTLNHLKSFGQIVFKQLNDHFLIEMISLYFCQTETTGAEEEDQMVNILSTIITKYLQFNQAQNQFPSDLNHFLSIIINKKSWVFLLNLFQSSVFQQANQQWANELHDLLRLKQRPNENKYLQLCHQVQFTISVDSQWSCFPKLHRPYDELRQIIDECIQNQLDDQWKNLTDWIQTKSTTNPIELQLSEIKVMLFFLIYYEYFCNNQLSSIHSLLTIIENNLQVSPEELRVFRAFIHPEQYLIGYGNKNDNLLNDMFQLDCQNEYDLTLRHLLVNLLGMIVFGGKQSFLWTFVFQPLISQHTYGFGSTHESPIEERGVHYDCGCILSQNGELIQFSHRATPFTVPAIYVVYFSTFGALAWHLLLFDNSAETLFGPIYAQHAINGYILGNNTRTKVCQFTCTRLLATYQFLTVQTNLNDACIILTRCCEQMARLTLEQQPWIKPVYRTLEEKYQAEQDFNSQIFQFVERKLPDYKTYINQINLQSQVQQTLQDFIDRMPFIIDYRHFLKELNSLNTFEFNPQVLKHILNSFEFLSITNSIYDLSQFYLLLHQTYTQLIERDEFTEITLKTLYERGQQYFNHSQYQNENKTHRTIIDNGIKAVNEYHSFADGLIRPGACDETQRFYKISDETPVNYLVTTENHDEGDIIMRILRVLVDYHNDLLDILDKQIASNENYSDNTLKYLLSQFTTKTVSILQVANENTGVITLNAKDHFKIKQLCLSSRINNENDYFLTVNSQLNFHFSYTQSQILRNNFLLCQINYKHIIQKYQCHTKQIRTTTDINDLDLKDIYLKSLSDEQINNQWSHLKDIFLDKLYRAHTILRHIASTLNNDPNDLSATNLYEFVHTMDTDNELIQQFEQYEIRDFQLCYIDHVLRLYIQSSSDFQYLFTNVLPLLRASIDKQLNEELNKQFEQFLTINDDQDVTPQQIQSKIQQITEFLNDLRDSQDMLAQQSTRSLTNTCDLLAIENIILSFLPQEIKCEHYADLSIHLIRLRSKLQEKKLNIEVKQTILWKEDFTSDEQSDKQTNRFHLYLNPLHEENHQNDDETKQTGDWTLRISNTNDQQTTTTPMITTATETTSKTENNYLILFKINVELVPCETIEFIQHIQNYRQHPQTTNTTIGSKFLIRFPNNEVKSNLWKPANFSEKLKDFFNKNQYDLNTFGIVDKDEIFIDFTTNDYQLPEKASQEYRIIDKQSLIHIKFHFRTQTFEYFVTTQTNFSTLIHRFIDENQLQTLPTDILLCFFNEYGQLIENINTNTSIHVIETGSTDNLCKLTVSTGDNYLFNPTTQWQQINSWLKILHNSTDIDYAFIKPKDTAILDENQTILSIINSNLCESIDIIDRNLVTKVCFSSISKQSSIYLLKSTQISSIFTNENIFQQLNLDNLSINDCSLVLDDGTQLDLSDEQLEQSLTSYLDEKNQSIHFKITNSVEIIKYDDKERLKIPLTDQNLTIEHLLELTGKSIEVYKYLAVEQTKRIIESNEMLSNSKQSKFLLVKENETYLVKIQNEATIEQQRYVNSAIIDNIIQENSIDVSQSNLLYANDFIPSKDAQLAALQVESTVELKLTNENLPITVTVEKIDDNRSVQFKCSHSMIIQRLQMIATQLLMINNQYYCLFLDNSEVDDGQLSLQDIDSDQIEFRFEMKSNASMQCSIKCSEQTIILPCSEEILMSNVIEEALKLFHIPLENRDMYELFGLDNDRTSIDLEFSINDIKELFPGSTMLPFELQKK